MSTLFSATNLESGYGKISAIRNIDLSVEAGGVVTVIGPNGAGKSTLLNCLMGLHPGSGAVTFDGERIDGLTVEQRLDRGLCLVAEKRELFGSMTVADNLELGGYSRRRHGSGPLREDLERVYETFPRMRERKSQLASTLSGGERQMLAIGRALMARPRLLMLDEPSLGLAPLIVDEVFRIIAGLRQSGVAILLVEQNAKAALHASDTGFVLEAGEIVLSGPSQQLLTDPRIEDVYLGASLNELELPADQESLKANSCR
jgi:branched-chain amino acid transport system ATP-binding protein